MHECFDFGCSLIALKYCFRSKVLPKGMQLADEELSSITQHAR